MDNLEATLERLYRRLPDASERRASEAAWQRTQREWDLQGAAIDRKLDALERAQIFERRAELDERMTAIERKLDRRTRK